MAEWSQCNVYATSADTKHLPNFGQFMHFMLYMGLLNHCFQYFSDLRGNCTPDQKLACFVVYLKIIITLKNVCILKLSKKLKNNTKI